MKAKEMAAEYNAAKEEERLPMLREFIRRLIVETGDIADVRRIKTDSAMGAILREVDNKWRAFAGRVDRVNPDAFKLCLHDAIPASKELLS